MIGRGQCCFIVLQKNKDVVGHHFVLAVVVIDHVLFLLRVAEIATRLYPPLRDTRHLYRFKSSSRIMPALLQVFRRGIFCA